MFFNVTLTSFCESKIVNETNNCALSISNNTRQTSMYVQCIMLHYHDPVRLFSSVTDSGVPDLGKTVYVTVSPILEINADTSKV